MLKCLLSITLLRLPFLSRNVELLASRCSLGELRDLTKDIFARFAFGFIQDIQMKRIVIILGILMVSVPVLAQKVDSLFFNLYTDSLKKGVYNYINVDGKMSNGQWMPLTSKELNFTSSEGRFEGNNLIIDPSFKGEKVVLKAVLKSNPALWKEITVYIKKFIAEEKLPVLTDTRESREPARGKKKVFFSEHL